MHSARSTWAWRYLVLGRGMLPSHPGVGGAPSREPRPRAAGRCPVPEGLIPVAAAAAAAAVGRLNSC
eukprot:3995451-Heterocapsa_arctica.AAC.1